MKHASHMTGAVIAALIFAGAASAQVLSPNTPPFTPPPPPPVASPKVEVPVVPQLDAPARQSYAPAPRPSFSDRVTRCLDDGAASGLGPNERATYSRSCAN